MQPGDILIIAAQLGMSHRGRSVRLAREVFVANEWFRCPDTSGADCPLPGTRHGLQHLDDPVFFFKKPVWVGAG